MNAKLIAVLAGVVWASGLPAGGGTAEAGETPTLHQQDTSALVDASKDAKAKRKGSTTKVITNADVKKADKSKVTKRTTTEPATPAATPDPTLLEKHEAERTARLVREETLKKLNATIARLETELAKLEQSYYEANDLDYRDTVIVRKFNETKARLDETRKQLE